VGSNSDITDDVLRSRQNSMRDKKDVVINLLSDFSLSSDKSMVHVYSLCMKDPLMNRASFYLRNPKTRIYVIGCN
jgi:hypothetical protein